MVRYTPRSLFPPEKETAVPVGQEAGRVPEPIRTPLLERQILRIKRGKTDTYYFDVLLTMHLSIFISVFNQLDAQNLFHNKFYFMPLDVSSTCAHHQEVKIA